MEPVFWAALAILVWLASSAFLRKLTAGQNHHRKLPPGPKPWPIVGNLHLIGPLTHVSFHNLSKKYGEIVMLRFGSRPVLVASSTTSAKEILKTHDQNFCSRPAFAAGKYTSYNYSDMTGAPYGLHWRQGRRIYLNELFSPKQLEKYEYIRVEEMRAFMSRLAATSGREVMLRDQLKRYTLTNICRMSLGDKYFDDDSGLGSQNGESKVKLKDLQEMFDEWFYLNGALNIGDWIPWLGFLDLQGYVKKMKDLSKRFHGFHDYVIADHMEKMKREEKEGGFVAKDIVDVMLQLAEDPNLEVKLTTDCIKGFIQNALAGGIDTAALTIEWAISELLKNPRIVEKANEELDRVIGRERWMKERDISELPYMTAIVKETMRLHPAATMVAPHFSLQDCDVLGYHVPKGTTVFVNMWSIGRDPRSWPEAEVFWPERFLGSDIDVKGQHFELLPFGSGRRMCPAYNLGLKIIQSTLANLLHGFEWKLPGNMKPEDVGMEEQSGLTTPRADPIVVVVKPRLSSHMY